MQDRRKSVLHFHFSLPFVILWFVLLTLLPSIPAPAPITFSPVASSLQFALHAPQYVSSYSHLHLSTAEIGQEREFTASVLPPLHNFLPAALVKHVCPHLRDWDDIPVFLLPVFSYVQPAPPPPLFFVLNSVFLCLICHNLVRKVLNKGWNTLLSLPFSWTTVSFQAPTHCTDWSFFFHAQLLHLAEWHFKISGTGSHKPLSEKFCFKNPLDYFPFPLVPRVTHTHTALKKTLSTSFQWWPTNVGFLDGLRNPWKINRKEKKPEHQSMTY